MTTPPVCSYEGSDYQTRFWEQADRAYEDRVEAIALRRLLPPSGTRLLELGAGAGRNTRRYAGFEHVVLVDYSRSQLEQAQQRLGAGPGYTFVAADIYRLPFAPAAFPAATMIRTLHHMADPPAALRQVRRSLASGGVFVLEFANKRNLKSIARWLLRRQAWNPFDRAPVEFAALNFDFHPRAIDEWLQTSAFAAERRLTVSHFRLPLLKRLLPLSVLVGMDSLAQWTGDLWQVTPSVFVRARATGSDEPSPPGALWRCPACGALQMRQHLEGVDCLGCRRTWPLRDGIYDFREAPG
ncbi:MAG: class I SAM-dependent methyltransferase [Anaerolineales bacterium]|jgi:ubiquinone/menaquinone biosynthesis C-methylase UbiE|nr:class I SAM-dependent methyltransferase [Anaerolineales bacterium]